MLNLADHFPRLLGSLAGIAVAASLIAPRTTTALVPLLLVSVIIAGRLGGDGGLKRVSPGYLVGAILAFFGFAALSALWSEAPSVALEKSAVAATIALAVVFAAVELSARPSWRSPVATGAALGFAVGVAFLAIDVSTGQALKIAVINALGLREGQVNPGKFMVWGADGQLTAIGLGALTRSMTPCILVLPAALLAILTHPGFAYRRPFAALLTLAAAYALFRSDGQTGQLAFLVGIVTALLAVVARLWCRRMLGLGWLAACLLMLPIAFALGQIDFKAHRKASEALAGASPEARIAILAAYADKVVARPVLGHGANMSYVLGPKFDAAIEAQLDDQDRLEKARSKATSGGMRQHPHNAYMQVWFELGAIGAVLFAALGLSVLATTAGLEGKPAVAALAAFAIAATVLAPSYGLWQYWFMLSLALGGFLTAVAALSATASPGREGAENATSAPVPASVIT